MKIGFSPEVKKELAKMKRTDPDLTRKIHKQLQLFTSNPTHPSLRVHKLSGNLKNFRSISITRGFRMVYQLKAEGIAYFVDLGTHDEVYRK
jgi:addiction module RelE/StbE family toxin